MAKMTKDEILVMDKENARLHEAAHAVVTRHFGYVATWRTYQRWEAKRENTWFGQTRFYGSLEPEHKLLIGLAGSLASIVQEDPDSDPGEAMEEIEDTLSDTDRESAGDFTEDDVQRCMDLLAGLMPRIQQEAKESPSEIEQLRKQGLVR